MVKENKILFILFHSENNLNKKKLIILHILNLNNFKHYEY